MDLKINEIKLMQTILNLGKNKEYTKLLTLYSFLDLPLYTICNGFSADLDELKDKHMLHYILDCSKDSPSMLWFAEYYPDMMG